MNASIDIVWKFPRGWNVLHNVLDSARVERQLGWRAATLFENRIVRSVLWSMKNIGSKSKGPSRPGSIALTFEQKP
jgi:hypothetical protein